MTRASNRTSIFSLSLLTLALAQSVYGETGQPATSNNANQDSTLELGEIQVSAAKEGALLTRSVLTSVDVLGENKIKNQNVLNSWELLGQMPGVQLTQFKQGTVSGKPSLRGFNGEGEINAVKYLIDGIPSNSNDGNMPYMDMIFPLDIESIEVVRGTNDPRYGLHNIAGNINMQTKQGGNYTQARGSVGSFKTRELQISKGTDSGQFSQNYFLAKQKSDGYRAHAKSDKYSVAGKWFYTPESGKFRVGLIARNYAHDAEEAGYLTAAQAYADPKQTLPFNGTDGGERRLNQISGHLDAKVSNQLSLGMKAYTNEISDNRWVTYSATQSQQKRVTNEFHIGALATLTWRPTVTGLHDFSLEGGVSTEMQGNESWRFNSLNRVPTAQTRSQQFNLNMTGEFVQAVIKPTKDLKIVPGLRLDHASGEYTNNLNGRTYAINNYGVIKQPKLSVVYSLGDSYSLYGNWGRSFQIGVGTATYKVNQASDLSASINNGWEMGVKFSPATWMNGRVAVWEQVASNEIKRKLGDPNNDSENVGKTKRNGLDIQVNAKPTDSTSLWAAYSWQDSKILLADTATPLSQGKEIDHVPHYLVSTGVEWLPMQDLKFGMALRGQGKSYTERVNDKGQFGGYWLVDASANYRINQNVDLDLQIKNLGNRFYEYVWWNTTPIPNATAHGPGDGRAAYLAVNVSF